MSLTIVAPAGCSHGPDTEQMAGHYFGYSNDIQAYRPLKGHLCIKAWRTWFGHSPILSGIAPEDREKEVK